MEEQRSCGAKLFALNECYAVAEHICTAAQSGGAIEERIASDRGGTTVARRDAGRGRVMKRLFGAFVAASLLCLAPAPTLACSGIGRPPPPAPSDTNLHWTLGYTAVGTLDAFIVAFELAAGRDMFGTEAAYVELAIGIAHNAVALGNLMGAAMLGVDSCGTFSSERGHLALSSGFLFGIGGSLIAHAIWSLADGDENAVVPLVSIDRDGAGIAVSGTF
jgi:hypothetical protein